MIDFTLSERIQCSKEEKDKLLNLINNLLAMVKSAQRHGLISLENIHRNTSADIPYFLKQGIRMVVDGIDPNLLSTILDNYIMAGNYKGSALLSRMIIRDALVMIENGENPLLIAYSLTALLGEEYQKNINLDKLIKAAGTGVIFGEMLVQPPCKTSIVKDEPVLLPCPFCGEVPALEYHKACALIVCPENSICRTEGRMSHLIEIENIEMGVKAWNNQEDAVEDAAFTFEDIFQLNDISIQCILREIANDTLTLAMVTVPEAKREKIFKNISDHAAEMIIEDLEAIGSVRLSDVKKAQAEIVRIVNKLEEKGSRIMQLEEERSRVIQIPYSEITETVENHDLLPCPFCGGAPKLLSQDGLVFISCPENSTCRNAGLRRYFNVENIEEVVETWNCRTKPSARAAT